MSASRTGLVLKITGSSLVTGLAFTGAFAFVLAVHCYVNEMTMAPGVVLARNGGVLGGSTALALPGWGLYWLWKQAPSGNNISENVEPLVNPNEGSPFIPKS